MPPFDDFYIFFVGTLTPLLYDFQGFAVFCGILGLLSTISHHFSPHRCYYYKLTLQNNQEVALKKAKKQKNFFYFFEKNL